MILSNKKWKFLQYELNDFDIELELNKEFLTSEFPLRNSEEIIFLPNELSDLGFLFLKLKLGDLSPWKKFKKGLKEIYLQ